MKYEGNRRLHIYPVPISLFPMAPKSAQSRAEMFRDGIRNCLFLMILPSLYPSSFETLL